MTTDRLELIETSRLVPYINNAPTHSAEQIKKLQASLREFGFVNPVLVDKNLTILAGHGRVQAALAEGIEKIPAVFVEHLTEAQKRAYILADNRLAEMAGWDEEILRAELDALAELNFDISLTGFEDFEFDDAPIEEDNFDVAEELSKPAVAKLGDVWHLGEHKIICGDSTKPETYERLLGGLKVDCLLTDPPYFVAEENTSGTILNDDLSAADGLKFLRSTFENFREAMANDASIYIFYATAKTRIFFDAFEDSGFHVMAGLVWKKDVPVLCRGDFNYAHEPIIFGKKKRGTHKFYGDHTQSTVLEFPRIKNSTTEGFGHPSSKPLPLISHLIKLSSKRGGKILDGFLGSGSTLIAAEQLGRVCYGVELSEKFSLSATVKKFLTKNLFAIDSAIVYKKNLLLFFLKRVINTLAERQKDKKGKGANQNDKRNEKRNEMVEALRRKVRRRENRRARRLDGLGQNRPQNRIQNCPLRSSQKFRGGLRG